MRAWETKTGRGFPTKGCPVVALAFLGMGITALTGTVAVTPAQGSDNKIVFDGAAKKAGDIKVKVKLVRKSDGQPAGECEVTVGIVPGEDAEEKASKVNNAINNGTLPCAALVNSSLSGAADTLVPDSDDNEIQNIEVTDAIDKAKVTVNGVALVAAIGRVRLDGIGDPQSEGVLCSVDLPDGTTATASVPMAGLPGDAVEQHLATALQAQGVHALWNGDLEVQFGPVLPWQVAGITLDFSTEGPGFGPGSFVGLETNPSLPTPVQEESWGAVKSLYR